MADATVLIEPSMAHHFRLEAWDALDDGGKLALGDYLSERLQTHGWAVPDPMTLRLFGPAGEPRSVLQWREPASGMTFSFIPGGTFRPGYDDEQIARLGRLRRVIGDGDEGGEEDPDELEPGEAQVFGGEGACDLRLKGPVEVPSFFLATELVRPNLPGLRSVGDLPAEFFRKKTLDHHYYMGDSIHFRWEQVGPVLAHYGWSLPTSTEFEWALRGGDGSLFYWGDDRPRFMELGHEAPSRQSPGWKSWEGAWRAAFDALMSASFDPARPREWPWCNRFGLAAMLPVRTWCARSNVPGDPYPLIVRGGAAYCYPWQGCGEWELLLNATESRDRDEPGFAEFSAVRPAIRMKAEA